MAINWTGLVAALATFFGIWFGHVAVRTVEAKAPKLWIPVLLALASGLGLEYWSLTTNNPLLLVATGILGVTLLWDALEFWRQQRRVEQGHAPANPANPRHERILAENPAATTLDLLKRNPVSRPVTPEEARQLVTDSDE
jgi:hypothetical protein